MYSQKQILDFIAENKTLLQDRFHLTSIGIFGSYARGEQTSDSDIDLIVEFENDTDNLYDLKIEIKKFFSNKFNLNVDVCRGKYLKPLFKQRILNEAIYVD